ncbi:MAG: hypothetical protein ACK41O_13620, partial [Runella zeae]
MKNSALALAVIAVAFTSCTRYFVGKPIQLTPIAISDTISAPTSPLSEKVSSYLRPFHDSLDARMNTVLVKSPRRLS